MSWWCQTEDHPRNGRQHQPCRCDRSTPIAPWAKSHRHRREPDCSPIKLLLLTGARRNEITRAKWEYIDWQKKTLLVPCSKSGRPRLIQLNSAALELLRSLPREPENAFIFPSPVTGRPSASLHFPWTRIRKRAGLNEFRLHDLRHSFASFLVNKGVSIYVVQGLLGHANVRATQRYAHLANETLSVAAELIPAVILPTQVLATLPDPPDAA